MSYSLEDSLGVSSRSVDEMFLAETHAPPNLVEDSIETLQHFVDNGYEIIVYSMRVRYMSESGLSSWLIRYGIPHSRIMHNSELTSRAAGYIDYHIDDSPKKLIDLGQVSNHKLLFDCPWNRNCMNIYNIVRRVYSWKEIKEVVEEENDEN